MNLLAFGLYNWYKERIPLRVSFDEDSNFILLRHSGLNHILYFNSEDLDFSFNIHTTRLKSEHLELLKREYLKYSKIECLNSISYNRFFSGFPSLDYCSERFRRDNLSGIRAKFEIVPGIVNINSEVNSTFFDSIGRFIILPINKISLDLLE
jgi:hypothetical protein